MDGGTRVHVGIGGNLGDRVARIEAACRAMSALSVDGELARSPLYESAPMGPPDQPDYLNAVCRFATALEPHALLGALLDIERREGRVRPALRWSARTLDLDLLLYGSRLIDTPDLLVPHPGILSRAFVLRPLADLDPTLEIPGHGTVASRLAALDEVGLRPFGDAPGG